LNRAQAWLGSGKPGSFVSVLGLVVLTVFWLEHLRGVGGEVELPFWQLSVSLLWVVGVLCAPRIKRAHRYLTGQILRAFIPSLLSLTLLTLLGLSIQAVMEGFDIVRLRSMLPYFTLFALPIIIPATLLASMVMVYGRLEGDNELLALKSAGVHLYAVTTPGVTIGLAAMALCTLLTNEVIPWARLQEQLARNKAIKELLGDEVLLNSKRSVQIHPFRIRYDRYSKGVFQGVNVWRSGPTGINTDVRADEGRIEFNPATNDLKIVLKGCQITSYAPEDEKKMPKEIKADSLSLSTVLGLDKAYYRGKPKYMSISELVDEFRRNERPVPPEGLKVDFNEVIKEPRKYQKAALKKLLDAEMELLKTKGLAQPRRSGLDGIIEQLERLKKEDTELDSQIAHLEDVVKARKDDLDETSKSLKKAQAEGDKDKIANLEDQVKIETGLHNVVKEDLQKLQVQKNEIAASVKDMQRQADRETVAVAAAEKNLADAVALRQQLAQEHDYFEAVVQRFNIHKAIHDRLAAGMTCLAFALVGIAAGMLTKRGNIIAAFAVTFGVALFIYYPLQLIGDFLSDRGQVPVAIGMWAPSILISMLGLGLLWKVYNK